MLFHLYFLKSLHFKALFLFLDLSCYSMVAPGASSSLSYIEPFKSNLNKVKTKVTESDKNQASRIKFINLVRLKWHSGTMEFSPRLAMVVAQGRAPHT